MAALIAIEDVVVWVDREKTESDIEELDEVLANQLTSAVLGVVSDVYDTEGWTTPETTPVLIRRIISMQYAGYLYHRIFSNDSITGEYGDRLLNDAKILLDGVVDGSLSILSDDSVSAVVNLFKSPAIAKELTSTEPKFGMEYTF